MVIPIYLVYSFLSPTCRTGALYTYRRTGTDHARNSQHIKQYTPAEKGRVACVPKQLLEGDIRLADRSNSRFCPFGGWRYEQNLDLPPRMVVEGRVYLCLVDTRQRQKGPVTVGCGNSTTGSQLSFR